MKLKCKAADLTAAIDAEWYRKQKEGMKERDVNCTVCSRNDCEPASHATWTEFDAGRGIWIEQTSEEFFGDSITKLNELADKTTCPECEGQNLTEDQTRCFDCDPEEGS
jgi:hypothetical protein